MSRLGFLYEMDLSHRAVSVFIYLSDRANKENECFPAIPTIAKELKLSESTGTEHRQRMEHMRLVI